VASVSAIPLLLLLMRLQSEAKVSL
jgi:hypothetical protein